MRPQQWLRSWLTQPRTHRGTSRRRSIAPRLEVLEDRTLPSTFTVTNLNDSGAGSLRDEVQSANANPGATIDFAAGLHGTITLTSGELDITSSTTNNGPGAKLLTVSGNNASHVFNISNDSSVSISDLTIADGATISTGENSATVDVTALGVGYTDASQLTLTNSTVSGNMAIGGNGGSGGNGGNCLGGGIIVSAGSSVTVNSSSVEHNSAIGGPKGQGGSNGQGGGGGVYNLGILNVVGNSVIKHNHASTSNDDIFG